MGTKERILETSLRLFAREGFEAVSTSAIAGELGMTKSALYKHFPDKRAIFDSLVDEMLERHRKAMAEAGVALNFSESAARIYAATSPEDMAALGEMLFKHWTRDESAVAFRRMLSIERYRDERAASVYDEFFVGGQLKHHEALFSEMIGIGAFVPGDPKQMALDFWAPIYLLMQAVDGGMKQREAAKSVRAHVLAFAKRYVKGQCPFGDAPLGSPVQREHPQMGGNERQK